MRSLPIVERKWLLSGEVQAELAALRSEPKAIFAAVIVELRRGLACFDEFAVDEAEALATRTERARHDAALIRARDGDLGAIRRAQHFDCAMFGQERQIVVEGRSEDGTRRRRARRSRCACRGRGRERGTRA